MTTLPPTLTEALAGRYRLERQLGSGGMATVERPCFPGLTLASDVLRMLQRGRVAERLSRRQVALESYRWVARIWRNADPELQPYVTEARTAVARLTAERP